MLLLLAVLACASPTLVGHWENQAGSFTFTEDGRVRMTSAQGQAADGQWRLDGDVLTLQFAPQTFQVYRVGLSGNGLVLADPSGQYSFARSAAAPATAPAAPAGAPPADAVATNRTMTDREFVQFLRTYRQMNGDGVTAHLAALSNEQHTMLSLFENLGSDVWTRACTGSYADKLVWPTSSGGLDCRTLVAQRQQAIQFGTNPDANADLQRDQLIHGYQCQFGEIDAGTCAAYYQTQSQISATMHETTMGIVNNLDSPCTRYYDYYGQYEGCW